MSFLKKRKDPLSNRSKELSQRISELEGQIQQLHHELDETPSPRLRSTAMPHAAPPPAPPLSDRQQLVFESIDDKRIKLGEEQPSTAAHYNDLGVRKYDLASLWARIRIHFQGATSSNPKLFKYLAAGNIQGLRPLRYEKRVARNRCIFLVIAFLILFIGLIAIYRK